MHVGFAVLAEGGEGPHCGEVEDGGPGFEAAVWAGWGFAGGVVRSVRDSGFGWEGGGTYSG